MHWKILLILLGLTLTTTVMASDAALILMPPVEPVVAGGIAQVDIVALNAGARATPFDLAPELTGNLRLGKASWSLTLCSADRPALAVSPGGFAVRRFEFQVPAGAEGNGVLEVDRDVGKLLRTSLEVAADSTVVSHDTAGLTSLVCVLVVCLLPTAYFLGYLRGLPPAATAAPVERSQSELLP